MTTATATLTADDIREAINSTRTGTEADRATADRVVGDLAKIPPARLFELLTAAGLEGIRSYDSRKGMLRRLHNRLTAALRCRERCEV